MKNPIYELNMYLPLYGNNEPIDQRKKNYLHTKVNEVKDMVITSLANQKINDLNWLKSKLQDTRVGLELLNLEKKDKSELIKTVIGLQRKCLSKAQELLDKQPALFFDILNSDRKEQAGMIFFDQLPLASQMKIVKALEGSSNPNKVQILENLSSLMGSKIKKELPHYTHKLQADELGIIAVKFHQYLKELDFSKCKKFGNLDNELNQLAQLEKVDPRLCQMNLTSCKVRHEGLQHLVHFTRLTALAINFPFCGFYLYRGELEDLAKIPNLKKLSLYNDGIDFMAWKLYLDSKEAFPKLESLILGGPNGLNTNTNEITSVLENISNLKTLSIDLRLNKDLREKLFKAIANSNKFTSLTTLRLLESEPTKEDLAALAEKYPNLKIEIINGAEFEKIAYLRD